MKKEIELCGKMSECLDELWIATESARNSVKNMKGNSWKTTALLLLTQYEEALNDLASLNSRLESVFGLKPGEDGFNLLVKKRS